jgi:class 3 adenylate cyclase/DNA-binding response OmpR family regulator
MLKLKRDEILANDIQKATSGERILVIDDSDQIRNFIVNQILKPNGFIVDTARDGESGLKKALSSPYPDLICLDYEMPRLNGLQVLQSLHEKKSNIPVILITSHGSEQVASQVFHLGARDYLIKPFDVDEMLDAIKRALAEVRLRRERDAILENFIDTNRELESRVRDLNVLHKISHTVTALLDLSELVTRIVEAALYITGAEESAIFVLSENPGDAQVKLQAARQRGQENNSSAVSEKAQQAAQQAIASGSPAFTASSMFVPLVAAGQVLGALGVSNSVTARFMTDHDRQMLQSLSDYTAITIQNATLFQQVRLSKEREKKQLRSLFEQYVAPRVVDRLLQNPQAASPGGVRQPTSILFADIRGFTGIAEQLPPEQLMPLLNRYLAAAATAVLDQDGTLDKFMGDAVMALFNAPLPQPDYALAAIRAALKIQEAVNLVHKQLPLALHMRFGIGIASGEAVVGNIGTTRLMNYTALGDCVNIARRLQETALGGQIIINARTVELTQAYILTRPLGKMQLKGRAAAVEIFELVGLR